MKTGLSQGERASGTHVWEKWYWWSQYFFYGILALATALAFFFGEPSWELRGKALAEVALLAAWQWFFQLRSPGWYYSNIGIRLAHISGVSFLFVALVQIYPDYWLFTFIVFWQIWAIGSVAWSGTAAVTLTLILLGMQGVPLTGLEGVLNLGVVAIASTVSIVLGLYISSLIGQSEERHRLIRELEETRKELAEEERRAGVLEERGRLAREIHDTLAQGFISIVTHLETAEEDLASDSKEARRHLSQAKQAARENLVESRRLVAALRPEILEGSSLPEALKRLAASWAESSDITLELNVTGDGINLPQELQVTLLRAAQEALSNVRRHANANSASMTLSYAGEIVLLDVQDDGRGFDPESESDGDEGGFGLRAMRERVERHGGHLLVESGQGEGTTLAVQLPARTTAEAK